MRKITISVAALLAAGFVQVASAATIKADFSKITAEQLTAFKGGTDVTINGFTFGAGSKCTLNTKNGVCVSWTLGGRSMGDARSIKFTPAKAGVLTYNVTNSKKTPQSSAVTTVNFDYKNKGANLDAIVKETEIAASANDTISVALEAGKTYWILGSEAQIFYSLSFEEASVTTEVDLTVKKDAEEATATMVLNKGTYKFSTEGAKTLIVSKGKDAYADNNAVVITENGTELTVKVAADKSDKDQTFIVKCELSDADLSAVKLVYQQQIAVMINQAGDYTSDKGLQDCALKASSLMAIVNNFALSHYNEYITTGHVAQVENDIAALNKEIAEAKAIYDGYVYAQELYGQKYDDATSTWTPTEPASGLLAKKAALDAAYADAIAKVTEEATKASIEELYNGVLAQITKFLADADASYAAGDQKDLAAYKASLNKNRDEIVGAIDEAIKSMQDGGTNAISYGNVVTAIKAAKTAYNTEAQDLYNLLTQPGDGYNDKYVDALSELNDYLRIINEVETENAELYGAGNCTETTQADFLAKLAPLAAQMQAVYDKYLAEVGAVDTPADGTLRSYYNDACNYIDNSLTNYLKTQIEDAINANIQDRAVLEGVTARTEVEEYYKGDIEDIKATIKALQEKVDGVNASHTIKSMADGVCDNFQTDADAIIKAVDDLKVLVDESVAEWDAWQYSLVYIKGQVEDNYNDIKEAINKTESTDKAYTQNGRFAVGYEKTIEGYIEALKAAAEASYKVEGTGYARDFKNAIMRGGDYTDSEGNVIYGRNSIRNTFVRDGYKADAEAAMTAYNTIATELVAYDLALNGKAATDEDPEVKGLKDVAVNGLVTIDGTIGGKSYADSIASIEKQIAGLKAELDAAVALNDTAHVKAMKALKPINNLVADIETLTANYTTNEAAWNKVQMEAARDRMMAEAERRVEELDLEDVVANETYTDAPYNTAVDAKADNSALNAAGFNAATYGNKAADLDETLAEQKKKIEDIKTQITNAKSMSDDRAAEAVGVLSTVVSELESVSGALATLSTDATKAKAEYLKDKTSHKNLDKGAEKNSVDVLTKEAAKIKYEKVAGTNFFQEEFDGQITVINNFAVEVEDSLAKEVLNENEVKLFTKADGIASVIKGLQKIVENEDANQKAYDAFNKVYTDAKLNDLAGAVTLPTGTPEAFFTAELKKYTDEMAAVKNEADKAYAATAKALAADGKTVLAGALDTADKYTDMENNMVKKGSALEDRVGAVKANLEALPGWIEANEKAYKEQCTAADELDLLRAEVFGIITQAQTSSYHKEALDSLLKQDEALAAYKKAKDEAYAKGACANDKSGVELGKQAEAIRTALTSLKSGWTTEYEKAVADDNNKRKKTFDDQYALLTASYSDAVGMITKLSKLNIATRASDVLSAVVGEGGIYDYADLIRTLKKNANAEYDAICASPEADQYDPKELYTDTAKTYQEEVLDLEKLYVSEVNDLAVRDYLGADSRAKNKLDAAIAEVKAVLGVDAEFKAVQDIIDEAWTLAALSEDKKTSKNIDFAYVYENDILPDFDTIDELIAAEKERLANEVWANSVDEYRALTVEEKELMGSYSTVTEDDLTAYDTNVVTLLDNAEEAWDGITENKYGNYAVAGDVLKLFTDKLTAKKVEDELTEDDDPILAELHTSDFWTAYDKEVAHDANDEAYAAMLDTLGTAQQALDIAVEYINALEIQHNSTLTTRINTIQGNITRYLGYAEGYHERNVAANHIGRINNYATIQLRNIATLLTSAMNEEYTVIAMEIGDLQHDYDLATAANIEDESIDAYKELIAKYTAENERLKANPIGSQKKDADGMPMVDEDGNPVLVTVEEVHAAYVALEKEIGKTKSELTALYDAAAVGTAQQAVADAIAGLNAQYEALNVQLADCHEEVVAEYSDDVEAFKAAIDELQKVFDGEIADNTVLLHHENNLTTAAEIAEGYEPLSADIAAMEEPKDESDKWAEKFEGDLKELTDELNAVNAVAEQYDYQQTGYYGEYVLDEDGNRVTDENGNYIYKYNDYRTYRYETIKALIQTQANELQTDKNAYTVNEFHDIDSAYILSQIDEMERYCAYYNANGSVLNVYNRIWTVVNQFNNSTYAPDVLWELSDALSSLQTTCLNLYYYNLNAKDNFVYDDIDGNPIIITDEDGNEMQGKSVVYMEEYPIIMHRADSISGIIEQLAVDVEEKCWIKGDIDHNDRITVADYDAVRQMVLELIEYTETDPIFYAADVNNDGIVNIGDVTQIGAHIMEGTPFTTSYTATSYAKVKSRGAMSNGNLVMTAEGSGLSQTIKVAVNSQMQFVGGQFDVVLPEGVRIVSVAAANHDAVFNEIDGVTRVLVSNIENTEIVNGQTFVELNIEVTASFKGGVVAVQNIRFADNEGTVFSLDSDPSDPTTGITDLTTVEKIQSKVYSVGGQLMNKMKKGLNIIVGSDGSVKKQVIK